MPYILYHKSRLHYQVIGHGSRVLLAFHGYGQNNTYYSPMQRALGKDYTIYAFDLFFHGNSQLNKNNTPLTKDMLEEIMHLFLQKEGVQKFSLMGFSMGGKFALTIVERFSERVCELFLIAPDGISTSFWYNIATYPGWLQQLFKRTVLKPRPFFILLKMLRKYKIVHKGLVRFAHTQMDSIPKRLRIYRSWVGLRELSFDLRHIVYLLNSHKIPVTMFVGQYDQVITLKRVNIFIKSLEKGKLVIMKAGHTHLLREVAELMQKERES